MQRTQLPHHQPCLTRVLCNRPLSTATKASPNRISDSHSPSAAVLAKVKAVAAATHVTTKAPAGAGSKVYVAAVPLEGFEAAQRLLGDRYPDQLALHTMVILQTGDGTITAFDFLPINPTAISTTASLLSGGTVHGVARTQHLRRLPRRRCWLVGTSPLGDSKATSVALSFQAAWHCQLRLMSHDCRHHTAALVDALCDELAVFDRLPQLKFMRLGLESLPLDE